MNLIIYLQANYIIQQWNWIHSKFSQLVQGVSPAAANKYQVSLQLCKRAKRKSRRDAVEDTWRGEFYCFPETLIVFEFVVAVQRKNVRSYSCMRANEWKVTP